MTRTSQQKFDEAVAVGLCNLLAAGGLRASQLAVASTVTGNIPGIIAGVGLTGIAALAYANNCVTDMDKDEGPNAPWTPGCQDASGTGGTLKAQNKEFPQTIFGFKDYVVKIISTQNDQFGRAQCTYQLDNGVVESIAPVAWSDAETNWYIDVWPENTCNTPIPPPPPLMPDPITHTDSGDGCEINVLFQGWIATDTGEPGSVWKLQPATTTRASGGIIGGCNFEPTMYVLPPGGGGGDGGGDPPIVAPWPPSPDWDGNGKPPWEDYLKGVLSGLAGGITSAIVNNAISSALEPVYPGGSYELKGVCELDPDGNPMDVTRSINFAPEKGLAAALTRLDALADMFQFAKDLKQPICKQVVDKPTGEPVTITFRSDLPSPVSGDPVRKIFTYFDQSGRSQLDHMLHWENFSWQAGPVIVSAAGTKLGKPQVWASTEAEGKRVIQHAAQIAGVDMADVEWLVGSPKGTRNGLSGTMRVYVDKASRIWVTKRDGPDGLPYVYKPT